ncbi:MAG TPA: site-specific integrase [Candidatus Lumbricidophila sp.]|nr:site-specific integrase [Candidatus Lumbricidophila sp.]
MRKGAVERALVDSRALTPEFVHRTVALSLARGSDKTAMLRLERLARVVMQADARITDPMDVWSADWTALPAQAFEVLDRSIKQHWGSVATRNAMRDSVRAVLRESLHAGLLTHDRATPLLNAMRPEKAVKDAEKQARGHVQPDRVREVFHQLALDRSPTARRDAALVALLVGAGLRRDEACSLGMDALDAQRDRITVQGKGGVVRDVPLAPGVRRAIGAWLRARGDEPGWLLTPLTKRVPRHAIAASRLSTNTVAQIVSRRFGADVQPHDLRRTFAGNLLASGVDLSVVSKLLGHANPATTAGYDRRGFSARQAAVDGLNVPFEDEIDEQ